jgi:hypothetical protein
MAAATSDRSCVAFNTHGWLKSSVTLPLRKCLAKGDGVYVRKSAVAAVAATVATINAASESPWTFYPLDDSHGGDIRCVSAETIEEIQAAADKEPLCVAFNTLGWLKSAVTLPLRKTFPASSNGGLYVRKGIAIQSVVSPQSSLLSLPFADGEGEKNVLTF